MKQYSIVVPVYNSSSSLNELTSRIHLAIQNCNKSFELIALDELTPVSEYPTAGRKRGGKFEVKISNIIITCAFRDYS